MSICAGPTICSSARAKPAASWLSHDPNPKGCPTQWSASASTCISANSLPVSPRPQPLSILRPSRRITRQPLLVALLKSLERETQALSDPAAAKAIPARVEQASTWVRGRSVQVHGPQACEGVTAGLDANGFLRVETANGLVTVQTGGLRAGKRD